MFADLSIPLSSKTGDDMQEMYDNKNAQMYIAGLVQDCSNSIANALELLQPCTRPSISH